MSEITIVELTAETSGYLENIAEGVFDNPVKATYRDAFLAEPSHHMLLALSGKQVVGMASGVVYLHPDKPPNMWINEVGVGDNWRRQGIGKRLMTAILDLSERLGCEEAWLGTETNNAPALALYRAMDEGEEEQGVYFTWDTEPD